MTRQDEETAQRSETAGSDLSQDPARSSLDAWQQRLLPFLVRVVVGLSVFFFVVTLAQLVFLHWHLQKEPTDIREIVEQLSVPAQADMTSGAYLLESDVIRRRYRMASTLMMAQVWIRYMGFVTGMIMAVIGSTFVLGKLREPPTSFTAESVGARVGILTTSPGIFIAFLGAALMFATILTKQETSVTDAPVYLPGRTVLNGPSKSDLADQIRQEATKSRTQEPQNGANGK